MNSDKNWKSWIGDITNWAAILAIIVVAIGLFKGEAKELRLVLVGFGFLAFVMMLKLADVRRFKNSLSALAEIPPLGLASGSVRALLAFGLLVGFGYCVYHGVVSKTNNTKFNEIFTAVSSLMSAVVGFYFGAKTALAGGKGEKSPTVEVSGIEPDSGPAGSKIHITNLSGAGFLPELTVCLAKGAKKIYAEEVKVVQQTRITCMFDLPQDSEPGKWHVVNQTCK